METIGQRLARLRKEKGLSQARLAELAGYSGQGAIGNIERGTRGYGASVVAVAKILGTTPEYLQTGVGPMRPASGLESLAAPTLAQALESVRAELDKLPPLLRSAGQDALLKWAAGNATAEETNAVLHALASAATGLPTTPPAMAETPVKARNET